MTTTYEAHSAVVLPAVSTAIAMTCEGCRRPESKTVLARAGVMLYSDIPRLGYAAVFSAIVSIPLRPEATCVGRRIGRSADAGMLTGMTMGSSGEALGDDGSSAMDGLHRDCGGSWCWHLVDNHFAARNVVDISDVDLPLLVERAPTPHIKPKPWASATLRLARQST